MQSRVEGHLLLDPTEDEAYREDGGLLLAYMPQANLVCLVVAWHLISHCFHRFYASVRPNAACV